MPRDRWIVWKRENVQQTRGARGRARETESERERQVWRMAVTFLGGSQTPRLCTGVAQDSNARLGVRFKAGEAGMKVRVRRCTSGRNESRDAASRRVALDGKSVVYDVYNSLVPRLADVRRTHLGVRGSGRSVGYLNWLGPGEIDSSRSWQVRTTFAESPDRRIMCGS